MKSTLKYFLPLLFFLQVSLIQGQVVGGRGNKQSSPKEVKAAELTKGAYTADVNLFNGAMSSSYTMGTVSTPSGLSYTLSMNYSSSFTGGDNAPVSKGIPYGEGWTLSLPSISITTESYSKYSIAQTRTNNLSFTDSYYCTFTSAEAANEGKNFWFAPEISIPGVISERFVYKYTEKEGANKGEVVFVPNKFDKYVEARLKNNVWRVITEDGTVYEFGVSAVNIRNASNQRYIQGNEYVGGQYIPGRPYQDVYTPAYEYLTWTVSKIYHPNYPNGQQIQFLYDTYGAFNFYQEFLQPRFIIGNNYFTNNFNVYKDVMLKTVRSVENFATEYIEKIELNYNTRFEKSGEDYRFVMTPNESGVSRKDSLYNYKTVYSTGIENSTEQAAIDSNASITTTGNFANWVRYYHVRSDAVQGSAFANKKMSAQNPYVIDNTGVATDGGSEDDPAGTNQSVLRKKITGSTGVDDIEFDDCFLESPKVGYSTFLPSGDIYEIRTLINNTAAEKFCNFDINIVAGKIDPSGAYQESDPSTSSISELKYNTFSRNRNTTLFTTFNQAVKWNTEAASASGVNMTTSNYFTMPNLPSDFEGFRIQVGPGNSDHNFSKYGANGAEITESPTSTYPNAFLAYYNEINANSSPTLEKFGCNTIPNSFGIGLDWHMMRRIYSEVNDYTYNINATRYKRWWNFVGDNYALSLNHNWENQPTMADEDVKLLAVSLIRYSKNPYMLTSVETYRMNGADSITGRGKHVLLSKLLFDYSIGENTVKNNYDPNPFYDSSSVSIHPAQKQIVFLLSKIREVPVNSANNNATVSGLDITKVPTTHYFYSKINAAQTNVSTYTRINTDVFALTSIIDRLGGETRFTYNEFDMVNGVISSIENWNPPTILFNDDIYHDDIQMGKPFAISFSLSVNKKTVMDDPTTGLPAKDWEYTYQTKRSNIFSPNSLGSHFHYPRNKYEQGYEKTTIKDPLLTAGTNRAKTDYTHYANEQNGLLFGKLKQSFSYNVAGQKVEKKDYEYSSNKAYENGVYRIGTSTLGIHVLDNVYDPASKRYYSSPDGDYSTLNSNVTIGVPDSSANLSTTILFKGTPISSMLYLEEGDSALFPGKYLTSYFTPLTKETVTSYDPQAALATPIIIGLRSTVVPTVETGSVRQMIGLVAEAGIAEAKYKYLSYSTITEYQYWDANPQGVTTCDGYRIISGDNPSGFSQALIYEPSWELYKKKTYSPELPDAYSVEENFYFHDIRNMANPISSGLDTLVNFWALNFTSGYKLRNLPYETRITTKTQGLSPVTKSQYYWYDALFNTSSNFTPDGEIYFSSSDTCTTPTSPPSGPPYADCIRPTGGLAQFPPPGYQLVIDTSNVSWWCPFDLYSGDEKSYEPFHPFEQPGESRLQIHIRDLKNKLFLRYTAKQIDTVPNLNSTYTSADYGSNKIMRFVYDSPSQRYVPLYPFKNLTDYYVEERNIYGQVKLEHDAKGLKTRYEYDPELSLLFTDSIETCNSHTLQVFRNMGLPNKVTVGSTLTDSLATNYEYYSDHSIKKLTDPNATEMVYTYDEYARLKTTKRNNILLSKNAYSYWDNDTTDTFEERAAKNYVESYTINEQGSTVAERSRAYLDPQGRKYEVLTQISPDYTSPTSYDTKMIYSGLIKYDNWDRSIKQYKSFKVDGGGSPVNFSPYFNSSQVSGAAINGQTQYENSQRSRALRASKYGQNITTGYTVNSSYVLLKGNVLVSELGLNSTERGLMIPGTESQYVFLKTAAMDEDGKKVVTYNDALGRQVATKTYVSTNSAAVTLFIYDSQGNQKLVINPTKQQSTYQYNLLGQVYKKNTVDAGEVRYMYNEDGQVVLEEDANARAGTDNSSTPYMRRYTYDDFGRLIKQERVIPSTSDNFKHPFYNQNYSDNGDYTDAPDTGNPNSVPDINFQMRVGYAVSLAYAYPLQEYYSSNWVNRSPYTYISSSAVEKEFVYHDTLNLSTSYLDSRLVSYMTSARQDKLSGRLSYSLAYNNSNTKVKLTAYKYNADGTVAYEIHQFDAVGLLGGTRAKVQGVTYKTYNLRGAVKEIVIDDALNGTPEFGLTYDYDGWNRLTNVYANSNKVASYKYIDELGLVDSLKYFAKGTTCNIKVDDINYDYDDRDRLTGINSILFDQTLYYDGNVPNTGTSVYNVVASQNRNGNINATKAVYRTNLASNYGTIGSIMDSATYYGYTYDGMNRLTRADASILNVLSNPVSTNPALKYGDEQITYDKVGNIVTLQRALYYSPGTPSPANQVTNWRYKYTTGTNKLYQIVENVSPFTTQVANYTYDANGSLRTDDKSAITSMTYGQGNLPYTIAANSNTNTYLYEVNNAEVYFKETSGSHEEYILRTSSGNNLGVYNYGTNTWDWEINGSSHIGTVNSSGAVTYYENDHLGSVRVTYQTTVNCSTSTATYAILNAIDRYAYGKELRRFVGSGLDRYGYQGSKHEYTISDDHYYTLFRRLNTDVIKWFGVDPKFNPSESPYMSMSGNPVLYNDVLGDIVDYGKWGQGGLKNRINSGLSRLFSANYRQQFNAMKNSTDTYHLNQVNNNPALKIGGNVVRTDATNFNVNYGATGLGIEQKGLSIFGTVDRHKTDNNSNNTSTTQTLKAIVPGSTVTIAPLPHPDEFTFNDQSGTRVFQGTFVRGNAGDIYATIPGFAPVTTLTPGVTGPQATTSFNVPAGTTSLSLTQRTVNPWPYTDATGASGVSNFSNSQWRVDYTKFRIWVPVIK